MDKTITVALVSGLLGLITAIASAIYSAWLGRRTKALERLEERKKERSQFDEPFFRAAFDLQSRIFNILEDNFIEQFLGFSTNERERNYAVDNTVFLIAQYMCWAGLVRREIQYSLLDEMKGLRARQAAQNTVEEAWRNDDYSSILRIFAGEQRAIGEALIRTNGSRSDCIGYGAFTQAFKRGGDPLIDALRNDIQSLSKGPEEAVDRLRAVQHSLIDLLYTVDPKFIRFPEAVRGKV